MEATMTEPVTLPEPIATYFITDKRNVEAIARCFTQDAVVKDEGHTYTGDAAIKQWKVESATKYDYTSVPLALDRRDGMVIVTSRLTGNFPGSPVDLRFCFRLECGKIAFLEIIP
jgi:hypothetical protein